MAAWRLAKSAPEAGARFMFAYYLRLAAVSLRRSPLVSALMVCAVAIGIGACMTFVNVATILAQDPIPSKSDVLFAVQLDSWDANQPFASDGAPPPQLTYLDAAALMADRRAHRQAAMVQSGFVVVPSGEHGRPFEVAGRATYGDFFAMFDVPFRFGGGWDRAADESGERVAVLSRETNDRLFGGEDSVGRHFTLQATTFRVLGVMDDWWPVPRFYDPLGGLVQAPADVFLPFETALAERLSRHGNVNCWRPFGDGLDAFLASECVWIQFWAELPSAEARDEYLAYLNNYVVEQKRLGRFPRPLNNRLRDVNQWIEERLEGIRVTGLLLAVGVMVLLVCLLNTVGLLLAKFLGKAPEVALRRALGASRRAVAAQHLVETGCIGLMGGAFGVGLTWLGLRGIDALFGGEIAELLVFKPNMVATAVLLAVAAALAAGFYPTWRASGVAPAALLKTQ